MTENSDPCACHKYEQYTPCECKTCTLIACIHHRDAKSYMMRSVLEKLNNDCIELRKNNIDAPTWMQHVQATHCHAEADGISRAIEMIKGEI